MGLTGAFASHCEYDHQVDVDIYWLHSGFEMSVSTREDCSGRGGGVAVREKVKRVSGERGFLRQSAH